MTILSPGDVQSLLETPVTGEGMNSSSISQSGGDQCASRLSTSGSEPSGPEVLTYAIGDIHGRLDLLLLAADAIMEDLAGRNARIICLGDYVDRGPDSKGVIDFLMQAQANGVLTCLKGNHEDMMLEALANPGSLGWWAGNGGGATLDSYGAAGVPEEHLTWLAGLPTVAEAAGRLFVHAGFFPGVALEDQDDDAVMWIRDRFLLAEKEFAGWPHIVHGHTPIHPWKEDPAKPELLPWRTNLDTGAFHTGVLTVGVFEGIGGPPSRVLRITLPVATGNAELSPPSSEDASPGTQSKRTSQ